MLRPQGSGFETVILHVAAPAQVGGLERVVEALAVGHARAGLRVHVAAVVDSHDAAERFLQPLAAHGVVVHPIVLPGRAYLREREALRSICRAIGSTVMHTHGYRPDVLASGVARRLGIASVTTVHGFTGGNWRNRIYEALQVRAFSSFDAVVAVSRPLAKLLRRRGVQENGLRVIVNGWSSLEEPKTRMDARAILGLPANAACVGFLGRLTREKGADVLLHAVSQLPHDVIVSFIGDGPERAHLEAHAAAAGLTSRIRWHGLVHNAGSLIRAFDVFALSSRTEGTPIVLFEAMAANVPIVVTRVGGVPDVVGDKQAVLVPSENPAALAAAIRRILDEPRSATDRVSSARDRLSTAFGVGPWLQQYHDLYREVENRRRARA